MMSPYTLLPRPSPPRGAWRRIWVVPPSSPLFSSSCLLFLPSSSSSGGGSPPPASAFLPLLSGGEKSEVKPGECVGNVLPRHTEEGRERGDGGKGARPPHFLPRTPLQWANGAPEVRETQAGGGGGLGYAGDLLGQFSAPPPSPKKT